MSKFLFCEDSTSITQGFEENWNDWKAQLARETSSEWVRTIATTYEAAMREADTLGDDDIISLDSRLGQGPNDGRELAERIRVEGKKCLIVWHSSVERPDHKRLGIKHCAWGSIRWLEKVTRYLEEWKKERVNYQYHRKSEAYVLRSQILTPFVLLHLGLQMGDDFFPIDPDKFSADEVNCCKHGKELMENGKLLIEFQKLLDLPSAVEGIGPLESQHPKIEGELKGWVEQFQRSDVGTEICGFFEDLAEKHFDKAKRKLNKVSNMKVQVRGKDKSLKDAILDDIKDFADKLEAIVAYVEFGEQPTV